MNEFSKELEELNFVLQKHKFRISSDSTCTFSLLTDNNSGLEFFENGNSIFITDKTSTEVVGRKLPPASDIPAKMIHALNGDIVLDARQGDIVLRGLNIRIEGTDGLGGEVTINSSGIVQITAPTTRIQGEYCTMSASSCASLGAGALETHGEVSNEATSGSDFIRSSFFGKILSAIKRFKKFFESVCGA